MKITIYYRLLATLIIALVFLLGACSESEPTEAEMFQAMVNADQNH
jgi:major membrane immunogen (membrane-anchored lipoprotein)